MLRWPPSLRPHELSTSAVIAKTASSNVAFKARRLSESIMESQDSFIMRDFEDAEVYFVTSLVVDRLIIIES